MTQDRQATVRIFRERLLEAMQRAGTNRSRLAQDAGIDRSTLSQLLGEDADRLPRADTVAAIATVLQVSLDWLMGLTSQEKPGAEVLRESVEVALSRASAPSDENLDRWHREAAGYKIRYVPTTLPDLAKTEAVLQYEYADYAAKRPDQAIKAATNTLAVTRAPDADFEICCARQTFETFAAGQGMWADLPAPARVEQLTHAARLIDELYPRLRLFLFDARSHFAAPYTVFGPKRATVFLGGMYFVFNTTGHIQLLSEHFDNLIRAAVVQAHEAPAFLRKLAAELEAAELEAGELEAGEGA